jgi:hypothetical protein
MLKDLIFSRHGAAAHVRYFRVLKIALKIKIKAIPPMHITKRTSGVIYLIACMDFGA